MMSRDSLQENAYRDDSPTKYNKQGKNIQQSQEIIYTFLLEIVKKYPPEEVLLEFKRLFIHHVDSMSSDAMQSLYEVVFSNNEDEFRNTLKRCSYILINNWDATRNYKPIQELIQIFSDSSVGRYTASPTLKRLRKWIERFVQSNDYEELKLFASRYEEREQGAWTSRYTSYLLVPQYIDLNNPVEQREAARALSRQLKDRFKFDLAMYIARSQTNISSDRKPKNPTALGDEALRLIKTIVARRGPFSYSNLANIFLNQTEDLSYQDFKQSLKKYLIFSIANPEFVEVFQGKLSERLDDLYADHHDDIVNHALILRTCNRVIEYLTTEDRHNPSHLFVLLLSQGHPIILVIALLKIVLICQHSRTHLEARIAELIQYYQDYPEDECLWIVNFLEIFNVTFSIYAENIQYNLIKVAPEAPELSHNFDPDQYRLFSQLKRSEAVTESSSTSVGAEEDFLL